MEGIIIKNYQEDLLMNIDQIFNAINYFDYNWLLSSYECNVDDDILCNKEYLIISPEQLSKILSKNNQFIWAVFSGFNCHVSRKEILNYKIPVSDSESFWKKNLSIQHPLAEIEIISWDSQYYIVISRQKNIIENIKKNISNYQNLKDYNEL